MTRQSGSSRDVSQSTFAFVDELYGQDQPTDSPGHSGIPDHVLQAINRLADTNGSRARAAIEDVLRLECPGILGSTARRLYICLFLAVRAERLREFLDGLGLARNSDEPEDYGPGTWTLTEDREGRGRAFVLTGIRTPGGGSTSVRLNAGEFNSAAKAWKAVQRAIGSGDHPRPTAGQWRRLWSGFNFKDADGWPQRAAGIRAWLWAEFVDRQAKEGVLPPDTTVGGLLPSRMLAPLPRAAKQKTRPRLEPRTGSSESAGERPQAPLILAGGLIGVNNHDTRSPHDSRDEFLSNVP